MPSFTEVFERARMCQRSGKLRQAVELCRQVVKAEPYHAEAWHLLATTWQALGNAKEACEGYKQALRLRPESADLHCGLGVALAESRRLEEAITHFRQAIQARPGHAPAHLNLGVALAQQGKPQEAIGSLEEALRKNPKYADAHYNLGNVLRDLRRKEEAVEHYRQAIALRPGHVGAYNNLGLTLTEMGKHAAAMVFLQQATRLDPKGKEAFNNLGLACAGLGDFQKAVECYEEALCLDAAYPEAHANLGSAYQEQGRLEEALACYEVALWLEPGRASAQYNRALSWLKAGNYEKGWPAYEWRWRRPTMPPRPFQQPRWDGSSLEGKTILLWCEQGLGDTIQFVRYAKLVQERGGKVVLECPGSLVDLLATCPGVERAVAEGEALPEFDMQAPLMSLPGLVGTTLETVPAEVPYLSVEAKLVEWWGRRLGGKDFKVGLVWQGNSRHPWDRWRSIPLGRFAPLAEVPGVKLVALQQGTGADQVGVVKERFKVEELREGPGGGERSFADTAAVMRNLDLVVSVDSSPAHLAGALGVPVWVAVAAVSDWRWMVVREDTPWYPTMRLFRQESLGAWGEVFASMARELQGMAAGGQRTRARLRRPVA
jgi:tetratricopeptide (TPR) repeat protein